MFDELVAVVDDLAFELAAVLEEEPGRDSDLMDELFPELAAICVNQWVLELVLDYCNRRKK